jgi:membrane protease YdiL (CAAX protease family)
VGPKGSVRERIVILLVCFGYLTLSSALAVVSGERAFLYDNAVVAFGLGVELALGFIAALLLARRGWTASDFGFRVSVGSTIAGIGLFAFTMLVCTFVYMAAVQTPLLHGWPSFTMSLTASPALILLFMVVNSFFEEGFVAGYVIEAARGGDIAFAVSVSTVVRLLYHTYQGPAALTSIVPIGLIFALAYLRWRNLWLLIVAHTAINLLSWWSG